MKPWLYIAVAGVAVLGIVYVYLHRQELGLGGLHGFGSSSSAYSDQSSSAQPAHINWQPVNRPNEGFKLEMPADVKEIKIPAYDEDNRSESINMIFSAPDGGTVFAVSWADNPPVMQASSRAPDRILDKARDGALERTQSSLVNEVRSTPGGFPARDFVARNAGGGMMDTRLLYAGNRLYMLTATFPSMSARREQDVTRFFNSFTASGNSSIPESLPLANAPKNN